MSVLMGFIAIQSFADTIPISLDTVNPHYFHFRGEPTILITSAEQYSSIQNLDFDYIPYLDELEDNGLNYTRIFCGVYVNGIADDLPRLNGGKVFMPIGSPLYPDSINPQLTKGLCSPWARSDSAGYFVGGNKFDLDTWDTLYFSRLTDFIEQAGQRGIVVEVTFYCGYGGSQYWLYSPMNVVNNINDVGKFGGDYGPYDDDGNNIGHKYPLTLIASGNDGLLEYQEAMIEKHLDELQYFDNVFFEVCNEPYYVDAGDPEINQNGEHCGTRVGVSSEWQAHMAKLIINKMDTMPHEFLLAQNIDHYYEKVYLVDDTVSPINMQSFLKIYPQIDILNFHYGARKERYIDYAVGSNYDLNLVISMDENGYQGGKDHTYRKQAWNYIIGGGGIFNNLDLSYTTNGFEGGQQTNPSEGYGGSPELHEQYGILKEFIHSCDFLNMSPNNFLPKADGIITDLSAGPDTAVIRCLANEGVEYVVYVEEGTKVSLTFDLPAADYKAEWINTKVRDTNDNILIEKTEFIYHGGDTVTLTSPVYTEEDIALHITAFTSSPPVIDTVAIASPDTIPILGSSILKVAAHDPDGEPLTYSWSKLAGPDTVFFSVNDTTNSDQTLITFASEGLYTLRVSIYDMHDTVESDIDVLVRLQHFQTVWDGTPFQPMNIVFDTATFNGIDLIPGDEIGIFDTTASGAEICVGVGMVTQTISSTDTLIIVAAENNPDTTEQDGFIDGHEIICKVWKESYQKEMDSVVNSYDAGFDIEFTSNGMAKVELVSTNYFMQSIYLITGWNIHSFMVMPDSLNMEDVHDLLIDSGYLIKIIDESGGFIQYIPGYGWFNTIGDVSHTEGYYIKVNSNVSLDITGEPISTPFNIPLLQGWNIHSYPLTEPQNALDAFQELIDNEELIKVVSESGGFIQEIPGYGWINTIINLQPDEGYYIKVNTNTSLTLDYPIAKASYLAVPALASVHFKNPFENNPYKPMNIVVKVGDSDRFGFSPGDEVAAFDGELCVGAGVLTESNSGLFAMIVATMDDPTTEETDGYTVGNPIAIKTMNEHSVGPALLEHTMIFGDNVFTMLGTSVMSISGISSSESPLDKQDFSLFCYPNPATEKLTITYSIPRGHIEIDVFNIQGIKVANLVNYQLSSGNYQTDYDLQGLHEGLYIITMKAISESGTSIAIKKFVKKK